MDIGLYVRATGFSENWACLVKRSQFKIQWES